MSLKIERNTVRQNTGSVVDAARQTVHDAAHDVRDVAREIVKGPADGPLPGTSGKHPIAESIGTAITGGKKAAGSNGYMMVRILSFCPQG